MSKTMTDRQSVAANATVTNALAGKTHEFLSRPSVIKMYATASAVGLFMTLLVGSEVYIEDQEVNAQNRLPILPDDFVTQGVGGPGERIVIKYRNTTVGAITAFLRVEVDEVG